MKTPTKTPLTIITFEDDVSPLTIDDNLISNPKDWICTEAVHASTPNTALQDQSALDSIDYDENPFEFSLFGRSAMGQRLRARFSRAPKPKTHTAPLVDDQRSDGSGTVSVEVERIRLRRLYYIALVKLSLKLGMAAKAIEFITVGAMGIKCAMGSWISLAIQLLLTGCSSATQLWRYNGKYSLPEETFDKELFESAARRERRCCAIHGMWKLCSAACLIGFSAHSLATKGPLQKDDLELFRRMVYLGAGFCTGGFVSRISLNAWVTYMTSKGLGTAHSLSAECVLSYIVSLASLKTALLCFVIMYKPDDLDLMSQMQEVNAWIDGVMGVAAASLAVRDLSRARKRG